MNLNPIAALGAGAAVASALIPGSRGDITASSKPPTTAFAPLTLVPASGPVFQFDQTRSETHTLVSEVVEHPIEQGANIADHVRQHPRELTVEVYISNTPIWPLGGSYVEGGSVGPQPIPPRPPNPGSITGLGSAERALVGAVSSLFGGGSTYPTSLHALAFPTPFDRIFEAYNFCLAIWEASSTFSVITSLYTYDDMVFTNVSIPRNEPGGASFNLQMKQVNTVTTNSVTSPAPTQARGAPPVNAGGQATAPATDEPTPAPVPGTSILAGLAG